MKMKHISPKEEAFLLDEIADWEYERYLIETGMYLEDYDD